MARTRMGIQFDGFLELARQIDQLGEGYLKQAAENALVKSAEYANREVIQAMDASKFSFTAGKGRSRGRARKSAEEIAKTEIEWNGTTAQIPVGVSWYEAPEITYLSFGTPHIKGDTKLKNATRVKGAVGKEVARIQQEEFTKVLQEAMNDPNRH